MPTKNLAQTTQVICYLTDCPIPEEDARRLTLYGDHPTTPACINVDAHKDVLAFLAQKGEVEQLGDSFIAFV